MNFLRDYLMIFQELWWTSLFLNNLENITIGGVKMKAIKPYCRELKSPSVTFNSSTIKISLQT